MLQINTADAGGGAEAVASELHLALIARGLSPVLAVGFRRTNLPSVVELPRAGWLAAKAAACGWPRAARAVRALADPGVALDLARGREDFRFPGSYTTLALAESSDVVHLHNLHGGYFDLRLLPRLSRLRATVITLHDEWTFTGHCALTLGCERWRDGCGLCPHLDVYPRLRRDGTAFNLSRKQEIWSSSRLHVVAPTSWLLERAQASVLRRAAVSWNLIPNGVDVELFKPRDREAARAELGISPDASVIVFTAAAARSNTFKDLTTLEQALDLIGKTQGPPVVALTAGQSDKRRRLGRVELSYLGFVDRSSLARLYSAADLYVHAARAEVQPLSLIEALASGLPAVASAVGGIPDVVRHGETGLLVSPGDPIAMAAAIEQLLDDAVGRAKMGDAAAFDARSRFAHADHVAAYLRIYDLAVSALVDPSPPQ